MMKFPSPTVIDSEPRRPSGVNPSPAARASRCSLRKLLLYFLRLGFLGWVSGGMIGATLTGGAFILPSFLMAVLVAVLYTHRGQLSWIQGSLYGIGAAVIAIIARTGLKLVRTTLGKDRLL